MSKVNVLDFLMKNAESMQYALVEYDKNIKLVRFVKYDNNEESIFLPYSCQVYVKYIFKKDDDKIEHMKNMIVGNILYEIYCPQTSICLPKEVDDIILITERECLLYLLEIETVDSLRIKKDSTESMRKGLIDSGSFDADTVKEIMRIFSNITTDYSFEKKIGLFGSMWKNIR